MSNINLSNGNVTGVGGDTLINIENILGSQYSDVLTGNKENNFLESDSGNDTLFGLDGDDTLIGSYFDSSIIFGGNGNDSIYGCGILKGGNGNDVLSIYSAGTMNGGDGDDTLNANYFGHDYIFAGNGADIINCLGNKDKINLVETSPETDQIVFQPFASSLYDFDTGKLNGYDVITGFALGNGISTKEADQINLDSFQIAADINGFDGVNSGNIRSHEITNGIISFDNANQYSDALTLTGVNINNVFIYLQNNLTHYETVAFTAAGNTYLFQDNFYQTTVKLSGIIATNLNTDGLTAEGIWLI